MRTASVLLAGLVLLALLSAWEGAGRYGGIDYYQFWVVGQAVDRSEASEVYSGAARQRLGALYLDRLRQEDAPARERRVAGFRRELGTYSTPFLYAVLHAFASGDYGADLDRHRLLSIACLWLAVLGLCRLLRFPLVASPALLLACLVWFEPLHSELRVGNVNALQLAALVLFLLLQGAERVPAHRWLAGFVLGVTVAFKPNLVGVAALLVIGWMLPGRPGRLLAGLAGLGLGLLAGFALGSAFFGSPRCWAQWLGAVGSMPPEVMRPDRGNYAPLSLLPWSGGRLASLAVASLLSLLVVAASWRGRSRGEDAQRPEARRLPREEALLIGAGCLVYLLSAPLVWQHYFLLAVPGLVLAFRPAPGGASGLVPTLLAALALLGLSATPIWRLTSLPGEAFFPVAHGLAALLLFGLMLHALWHPQPQS